MKITLVGKRTPQQIFARLTEMEKIGLRGASHDRVTWIANNTLYGEVFGDRSIVEEVQTLCLNEMKSFDTKPAWWFAPTYKF